MNTQYNIRHATPADLPVMIQIFEQAKRRMTNDGNTHQWGPDYPSTELLLQDMNRKVSYVITSGDTIVATFVLLTEPDENYAHIDGEWLSDRPYGTIHRLARCDNMNGVFSMCVEWALKRVETLRADTHKDNLRMQHLLRKEGFVYCGIIRLGYKTEDPFRTAWELNNIKSKI